MLFRHAPLANPGEGVEDVLAGGLTVHAVLVIGKKDDVCRLVTLDLDQVNEEIACPAAGLTELAFLVEIVDFYNDGTGVWSECANMR